MVEPTLRAAWVDQAVVAVEILGRVAVAVEFIVGAVVAATDWSSYRMFQFTSFPWINIYLIYN